MDFAPSGYVSAIADTFISRLTLWLRYQIATGSGDDTVRIWDLRALKTQYIIPAHKSSVSDLKFYRNLNETQFVPLDAPLATAPLPAVPNAPAENGGMSTDPETRENGHMDLDVKEELDVKPILGANGEVVSNGYRTPASQGDLPKSGLFLVTAGFDCNVRIWSADEWNLIRNLPTDSGKVMSVDVSSNGKFLASASYSRSFHLFGGDNSF